MIGIFGVFLPWRRGIEFLDPVMLAGYACLSMIFAGPAAAQIFAGSTSPYMTDAMARVTAAVLYGESMAVAFVAAGLVMVYSRYRHSGMFAPDLESLAFAGMLGITGSLAFATIAGWLTLRFSASAARGVLRVLFLLLLYVFFFRSRWLPEVAGTASTVCLGIAAVAALALRSALGRPRT